MRDDATRGGAAGGGPSDGDATPRTAGTGDAVPRDRRLLVIRGLLITVGVVGLVAGALILLDTQRTDQVVGVAVYLLLAILVHDAVVSPIVFGVGLLMRKAGRRLPAGSLVILQAGVVMMAVMTLVVVPEIRARAIGNDNPTILIADYAPRLALMWAVTALVTVALAVVYARTRRTKDRSPVSQA